MKTRKSIAGLMLAFLLGYIESQNSILTSPLNGCLKNVSCLKELQAMEGASLTEKAVLKYRDQNQSENYKTVLISSTSQKITATARILKQKFSEDSEDNKYSGKETNEILNRKQAEL